MDLVGQFKRSRRITIDDPRSGKPSDMTTSEIIGFMRGTVFVDRTVPQLAESVNITTKIARILVHALDMKKIAPVTFA